MPELRTGNRDAQEPREIDDLRERAERDRLQRENERLRRELERVKRQLDEARRAAHRQAAPVAKRLTLHPSSRARFAAATVRGEVPRPNRSSRPSFVRLTNASSIRTRRAGLCASCPHTHRPCGTAGRHLLD